MNNAVSTEIIEVFFDEVAEIATSINTKVISQMVVRLARLRSEGGRLFLIGAGGSAGNCSHAVNDFRKLCGIEAYSPVDNVSELTARVNDEGWETVFSGWLRISKLSEKDVILIFSVGGGNVSANVSVNIVEAVKLARSLNVDVLGVVGSDGGYTAEHGQLVLKIPVPNSVRVTPHSEAFQAVVWHCLVSHPLLQSCKTKW